MYNLYAGECSFNKDYTNGTAVRHVRHANIVQRVKIRYKIKIDYRVSGLLFLRCSVVQTASTVNDKASFAL